MSLDQLMAKLRKQIPDDPPNTAFCRPLRVCDVQAIVTHLERLKKLEAGLLVVLEAFAVEPEGEEVQG